MISDADSKNNEGISAAVDLTLTWTDVPGVNNIFEDMKGNVVMYEGEISASSISYGCLGQASTYTINQLGTGKSFHQDVNRVMLNPTANYTVYFKDATWALNVSVTASPFD